MTKLDSAQAQDSFLELLSRVGDTGEQVVIEQEGQAIAAIISYAELERYEALEDALDSVRLRRAVAKNEEFVTLGEVIAGYNDLHNTDFDLNSIIDD